jgi:hypothetical protein
MKIPKNIPEEAKIAATTRTYLRGMPITGSG